MHDDALLLRIRVVVVSTRAAVRSLHGVDGQVAEVLGRGRGLLEDLEPFVIANGSHLVRDRFAQARAELAALDSESR